MGDGMPVIAWVESPLQLIGAAEWAAAHDARVPVAGRLTTQMSETADELIARGARFGELAPYLGIPWNLLARHSHWLVGDGFSGQFRLAASVTFTLMAGSRFSVFFRTVSYSASLSLAFRFSSVPGFRF